MHRKSQVAVRAQHHQTVALPCKGLGRIQHNYGSVGTNPIGTSVTTGASAGTKTSPATQLIASTNFDAYWIIVTASNYAVATTASRGAMDIMIGGATEDVLIPNLLFGNCGGVSSTAKKGMKSWGFPLYIPSGTRIAAAACGDRTSTAVGIGVYLIGGDGYPPWKLGSKVVTYGIGSLPAGTAITPGTSGAEQGTGTQLTASTTEAHFAFLPSFQESGTTINLRNYTMDLGIGAATEDWIESSWWFSCDSNEAMDGPVPNMPVFVDVPASTRMALRVSNNGTSDGSVYECALHAVS